MLSNPNKFIENAKEAAWTDGMFDHDDIIQNLVFVGESISKMASNEDDIDEVRCVMFNLQSLLSASAYIALMRKKMEDVRKGGASC